jgi:hypothetical protein
LFLRQLLSSGVLWGLSLLSSSNYLKLKQAVSVLSTNLMGKAVAINQPEALAINGVP